MKSQLREFLSSCLHRLKISKIWIRKLVSSNHKTDQDRGEPKGLFLLYFVFSIRSSRSLSTSASNQLVIHFSLKSRLGFQHRKSILDQAIQLTEKSRIFFCQTCRFDVGKTLSGTMALHASC